MDIDFSLIIEGGALQFKAKKVVVPCTLRSSQLTLLCPSAFHSVFFNVVLLPCSSFDVPCSKCTAGTKVVILWVKKIKSFK